MTAPLLVVAHEGQRNGATVVLLDLLRSARGSLDLSLQVVVRRDGPLASALRALDDGDRAGPAAVLINSAMAAAALADVPDGVPALVYVHEEGEALRQLPGRDLELLVERPERILCVSSRAREDLVALGVGSDRIGILPPIILPRTVYPSAPAEARRRLGLAPNATLVVGCGEASWRKGTDLFVLLARELATRPDVHLAWIGRRHRSFARVLDHDVEMLGASGRLTWVGEVTDAQPLLAAADLLVVTSREDPQPLVALEAALASTASVGFAGTGLDDLVDVGGARSVPYPDVPALGQVVASVLDDGLARGALVEAARRVAAQREPAVIVPRFVDELRALLGSSTAPQEHR